jgi:formylglycine-generating enzyme required for sulfatase activity
MVIAAIVVAAICLLMPGDATSPVPAASSVGQAPDSVAQSIKPEMVEPEMVQVQGGTFMMGTPVSEKGRGDNETRHQVTLSSFLMGKYEVTQAQWEAVMGNNPSSSNRGADYPVENVSWDDIQTYLQKLNARTGKNYRLPTESEWEYAARGGKQSQHYTYSGSNSVGAVSWYIYNSEGKTHPVGQKSPNELGIYDMTGNVWEWCNDWYGTYPSSAQTNPKGFLDGSTRVMRGGSFSSTQGSCRAANRYGGTPDKRGRNVGFRVVAAQ